jgi:hypothetical protein
VNWRAGLVAAGVMVLCIAMVLAAGAVAFWAITTGNVVAAFVIYGFGLVVAAFIIGSYDR